MPIKTKTGSESSILSVGVYRPDRLVPNSEIVDAIDSSDEWIIQRTSTITEKDRPILGYLQDITMD